MNMPTVSMKTTKSAAAFAVLLLGTACASTDPNYTKVPAGEGFQADSRSGRLMKYCAKLNQSGDYHVASGMCARAHEIEPQNPKPLMLLADSLIHMNRHEEAISAYRRVIEGNPRNQEALYRMGRTYMKMAAYSPAMSSFEAAAQIDPSDARVQNALGILKDQLGDHYGAQAHYRQVLVQDPKNISVANNLGLSLILSGNRTEAIALLSDVVSDPRATEISHRNLAMAYEGSKMPAVPMAEVETQQVSQLPAVTVLEQPISSFTAAPAHQPVQQPVQVAAVPPAQPKPVAAPASRVEDSLGALPYLGDDSITVSHRQSLPMIAPVGDDSLPTYLGQNDYQADGMRIQQVALLD